MEGSGGREGRGPMKSVNSRAHKVAVRPWASERWQLATHVGNMRTRSASLVRSLPDRQSAGPQVRLLPMPPQAYGRTLRYTVHGHTANCVINVKKLQFNQVLTATCIK